MEGTVVDVVVEVVEGVVVVEVLLVTGNEVVDADDRWCDEGGDWEVEGDDVECFVGEWSPTELPAGELEKPPATANATRATRSSKIAPDEAITAFARGVRRRRCIARDRNTRSQIPGDDLRVDDELRIAISG